MSDMQYALVRLFHPAGPQVSIPMNLDVPITADQARDLLHSVDALLMAGWMNNAPGLEEGELMEEVSSVARRIGADDTNIIDFYSSNTRLAKKFMHVYLNSQEDVAAFVNAAGIKLDDIPVYDGKTAIERTDRNAPKYINNLPAPIKLVFKINPRWEKWKQEGGEGLEPHKRLLVRYEGAKAAPVTSPAPTAPTAKPAAPAQDGNTVLHKYKKLSGDLVTMLVKKTNLRPSVITPILASIPEDTITFEDALALVNAQGKE